MANRVFFAVQAVGIAPQSTNTFVTMNGIQSVGITTSFNLEQVFQLGQLSIYENVENIPDVEVTLEKVLDGEDLLYHACTRGATSGTLSGRSARKANVSLSIYDDTQDSASGVPTYEVNMSGMYISSVSYNFPTEGNCTESVTLVGNNKVWNTAGAALFQPNFLNNETAFSGVQRREDVVMGRGAGCSLWPSGVGGIPGIAADGANVETAGVYGAHISNVTVSVDFGREAINELGRKGPYFRFVNFPVEVRTDIEVITTTGDLVEATEEGINADGTNLNAQRILIITNDSTTVDLGSQNKLSNVTYGGGDTGGGQATVTYSYLTFNDFTVTHDADPG